MLRHSVTRKVRALPKEFVESLLHPDSFLSLSKYVESIVNVENDIYEVVFKWVKLGMTKRYWVKFRVVSEGNTVVYESLPDSENYMKMVFTVVKSPEGFTDLNVYAEMEAGTLAKLLGKKDFAGFVEELVDSGIKEHMRRMLEESKAGVSCETCTFYEATRRYCYALEKNVDDPSSPPCGGKFFKPA